MSEGLRAEDVKEALDYLESVVWGPEDDWVAPTCTVLEDWLASQEQTPDRRVVAQAISDAHFGTIPGDVALILADAAIAALVGFHPQPEGDER